MANARYWCGILYPENMLENWEDVIGDKLQLPYCYCKHDSDTDNQSEHRKEHVHVILVFTNTTTKNHAMRVFSSLSSQDHCCLSTCEQIFDIRHMYEYLIHNTESAKKQGKFQYPPERRIAGNNFDIGSYEQVSLTEKNDICKELYEMIRKNNYTNFVDFFSDAMDMYSYETKVFEIIKTNSGFFERLTRGNFQRIYNIQSIRQTQGCFNKKEAEEELPFD